MLTTIRVSSLFNKKDFLANRLAVFSLKEKSLTTHSENYFFYFARIHSGSLDFGKTCRGFVERFKNGFNAILGAKEAL